MSRISHRKAKDNTKVVNLGPIGAQSCNEVKGELTEKGDCLGKATANPKNPDEVTYSKLNYQKAPSEE